MTVTRGFGNNSNIITRGYGITVIMPYVQREVLRLFSKITTIFNISSKLDK